MNISKIVTIPATAKDMITVNMLIPCVVRTNGIIINKK